MSNQKRSALAEKLLMRLTSFYVFFSSVIGARLDDWVGEIATIAAASVAGLGLARDEGEEGTHEWVATRGCSRRILDRGSRRRGWGFVDSSTEREEVGLLGWRKDVIDIDQRLEKKKEGK